MLKVIYNIDMEWHGYMSCKEKQSQRKLPQWFLVFCYPGRLDGLILLLNIKKGLVICIYKNEHNMDTTIRTRGVLPSAGGGIRQLSLSDCMDSMAWHIKPMMFNADAP